MDVSVIYVNWNCADEILASVATVRRHAAGLEYEIIAVDNASAEDPGVLEGRVDLLVRNTRNAGFGAGCNLGASRARGRHLLFLNPDTRLHDDVLSGLSGFLDATPATGACGPMVLEPDGRVHYGAARSFLSIGNDLLEHSTLTFRLPGNRLTGRPYYSYWDHASTRDVDCLLGACMLFRADVFHAVGGFDEKFFLYCEEVDLCRRVWQAGHAVTYVHSCRITHSARHSTIRFFGSMGRLVRQYLESEEYYFRKHHGRAYALAWRGMIAAIYGLRYLRRRDPDFLDYVRWSLGHD